MRSGGIQFKLDLTDLLARARRQVTGRLGDVTLNLPFISIAVSPRVIAHLGSRRQFGALPLA
jgi:hypothetical protein